MAVLGASNFTYAEARWTQSLPDWIGCHVGAFASMTADASGMIAGLALGIGHCSLTKWLARNPKLPIVSSRN